MGLSYTIFRSSNGLSGACRLGRTGAAYGREKAVLNPQGVAHIVEPDRVRQQAIAHGHDRAPVRKVAAELVDSSLLGRFGDKVAGNEIAKPAQPADSPGELKFITIKITDR